MARSRSTRCTASGRQVFVATRSRCAEIKMRAMSGSFKHPRIKCGLQSLNSGTAYQLGMARNRKSRSLNATDLLTFKQGNKEPHPVCCDMLVARRCMQPNLQACCQQRPTARSWLYTACPV